MNMKKQISKKRTKLIRATILSITFSVLSLCYFSNPTDNPR